MKKSRPAPHDPVLTPLGGIPEAPGTLKTQEGRDLWRKINSEFELSNTSQKILETSLLALQRMRQAEDILARDGLTSTDRFGQTRVHPLVLVERDSRHAFIKGISALGLSLEPLTGGK